MPKKIACTLLAMTLPGLPGRMGRNAVYTDEKKGTGRKKIKYQMEMVFARQTDLKENKQLWSFSCCSFGSCLGTSSHQTQNDEGKKKISAV